VQSAEVEHSGATQTPSALQTSLLDEHGVT
jgi:hypothetical protein